MECRRLLSAAACSAIDASTITPAIAPATVSPDARGGVFNGYTPAQIRKAYGFDQIAADGTGQTIAIVDAYRDPNLAADVKAFDAKYGLPDPVINLYNQRGANGSAVRTDRGWASEIALDVEWAHAIAPGATIAVVMANSDNTTDLVAAVNAARNLPGVSVVSMSWGGGEFRGQTTSDATFTTPAGHQGVSFVAAAGDEGVLSAEWPASSPNVLGVGGTTLTLTSAGTYGSETTWRDSTGGTSIYEKTPSYQTTTARTVRRSTSDVSYDADPNTGFAVYDTYGDVGWDVVGGTSAGTPQWAALIALANQQRVAAGKGTLDGGTGTLPAIYSLYTSATSSTYTAAFNDVTTGSVGAGGRGGGGNGYGGRFIAQRRHAPPPLPAGYNSGLGIGLGATGTSGGTGSTGTTTTTTTPPVTVTYTRSAAVGYDQVTGLGTPKAPAVVSQLVSYTPVVATTAKTTKVTPKTVKPKVVKPSRAPAGEDAGSGTDTAPLPAVVRFVAPRMGNAQVDAPSAIQALVNAPDADGLSSDTGASSASAAANTGGRFIDGLRFSAPATYTVTAPLATLPGVRIAAFADALQTPGVAATTATVTSAVNFTLAQLDPSAFADSVAAFARESTEGMLPTATIAQAAANFPRAWAITLGVLAADAVLVGQWYARHRARNRRITGSGSDLPFALARLSPESPQNPWID